jgi:uncharacterized protein DUF6883
LKLPQSEHAFIDPRKLRDYVLSPEHPVGRFKAAFFAGLGFTPSNWEPLERELRRLAQQDSAEPGDLTAFGQKYLIRGRITGPTGRGAAVLAVWIVLKGEKVPRFVTVYPEK